MSGFLAIQQTMSRRGTFDGYTVQGHRYQVADGGIGWNITSWLQVDPVHTFWVSAGVFNQVSIYMGFGSNQVTVQLGNPVLDISPGEKAAVLKAISEWENSPDKVIQ